MPILKTNAYGHGLVPVARHLASLGATTFGVAFPRGEGSGPPAPPSGRPCRLSFANTVSGPT
jgi:hypothetical protein